MCRMTLPCQAAHKTRGAGANFTADIVDVLMQFRDLQKACGGPGAYAVLFAVETSKHGRESVQIYTFASGDHLLASMGFDLRPVSGPELNYHIMGAIYQALAKQRP